MIYNFDQGTEEWFAIRRGKFTASTFKDLFATKSTATYQNAIKKVAYERLTGESPESFTNDYMARGSELEPQARRAYESYTFTEVEQVGFYELNEWVGCSPDGIIMPGIDDNLVYIQKTGSDSLWSPTKGLIEIKCPSYATMIDYLRAKKLPNQYLYQVQGQMWITGAGFCDFVAYHPKLPLLVVRVMRDENVIEELKAKIDTAIKEAQEIIDDITNFKN